MYYETKEGIRPFANWILSIKDLKTRALIRTRIDRVKLGNLGYCRSLGQGVTELKIDYGPGYRIYFGQIGTKLVILLCGGHKDSQDRDIKQAHNFWADYRSRD